VKKNSDKKEFKLEPKVYKEKLHKVELLSISLDSFSAKVNRDKIGNSMKTSVKDTRTYDIKENGDVVFLHSFELINTEKLKKDYGIKINCTFSLCFSSKEELTRDFWDIFSAVNLHINTWPFFREFVQNTTQRMSVFPLTLPLLKQ